MNLSELRSYCGSLLDYDPINPTYTQELTSFLNDAQGRLLVTVHGHSSPLNNSSKWKLMSPYR